MTRLVATLLVLVAVLLLPLGMTPAAAAPVTHQDMASMPMGHCPDQGSHHESKGGIAECTMACAGALPAAEFRRDGPVLTTRAPTEVQAVRQLRGLHPETATPPPKIS
jgi:hypothetical protein